MNFAHKFYSEHPNHKIPYQLRAKPSKEIYWKDLRYTVTKVVRHFHLSQAGWCHVGKTPLFHLLLALLNV